MCDCVLCFSSIEKQSDRNLVRGRGKFNVYEEAAWPSGQRVGLVIRWSRVRVPLWPLAGFALGRPEFKFSATGCLLPVGVFNPVMLYLNYLFLNI